MTARIVTILRVLCRCGGILEVGPDHDWSGPHPKCPACGGGGPFLFLSFVHRLQGQG